MVNRSRWKRVSVFLAIVTVVAVRLASWQGLCRPVRVSGGSMAENLLGEHFQLACDDCGFLCRYDAAAPPRDQRVVCPNCGFVNDHPLDGPVLAGRRVLIDRLAYTWRTPKRWEVVAFRTPDDEQWLSVKRVVGLPGERISFRQGDLLVDGQPVRKSLSQLRAMAMLVHDNTWQPQSHSDLPPRWQSQPGRRGWQPAERGFEFQPDEQGRDAMQWLAYHHWPCFAGSLPRTQTSPILDNYGYNQQVSRQLNVAGDIMFSCRVKTPGRGGRLAFEAPDRNVRYRVEVRFDTREVVLTRGPRRLKQVDLPYAAFARGVDMEFALCDGQILFGIDRRELIRAECRSMADMASDTSPAQLAVGATGLDVSVERLQVLRDLYYLPADFPAARWQEPAPLGPDEAFVVGDNVPISRDSRHQHRPGVPLRNLLGPVHRVMVAKPDSPG